MATMDEHTYGHMVFARILTCVKAWLAVTVLLLAVPGAAATDDVEIYHDVMSFSRSVVFDQVVIFMQNVSFGSHATFKQDATFHGASTFAGYKTELTGNKYTFLGPAEFTGYSVLITSNETVFRSNILFDAYTTTLHGTSYTFMGYTLFEGYSITLPAHTIVFNGEVELDGYKSTFMGDTVVFKEHVILDSYSSEFIVRRVDFQGSLQNKGYTTTFMANIINFVKNVTLDPYELFVISDEVIFNANVNFFYYQAVFSITNTTLMSNVICESRNTIFNGCRMTYYDVITGTTVTVNTPISGSRTLCWHGDNTDSDLAEVHYRDVTAFFHDIEFRYHVVFQRDVTFAGNVIFYYGATFNGNVTCHGDATFLGDLTIFKYGLAIFYQDANFQSRSTIIRVPLLIISADVIWGGDEVTLHIGKFIVTESATYSSHIFRLYADEILLHGTLNFRADVLIIDNLRFNFRTSNYVTINNEFCVFDNSYVLKASQITFSCYSAVGESSSYTLTTPAVFINSIVFTLEMAFDEIVSFKSGVTFEESVTFAEPVYFYGQARFRSSVIFNDIVMFYDCVTFYDDVQYDDFFPSYNIPVCDDTDDSTGEECGQEGANPLVWRGVDICCVRCQCMTRGESTNRAPCSQDEAEVPNISSFNGNAAYPNLSGSTNGNAANPTRSWNVHFIIIALSTNFISIYM